MWCMNILIFVKKVVHLESAPNWCSLSLMSGNAAANAIRSAVHAASLATRMSNWSGLGVVCFWLSWLNHTLLHSANDWLRALVSPFVPHSPTLWTICLIGNPETSLAVLMLGIFLDGSPEIWNGDLFICGARIFHIEVCLATVKMKRIMWLFYWCLRSECLSGRGFHLKLLPPFPAHMWMGHLRFETVTCSFVARASFTLFICGARIFHIEVCLATVKMKRIIAMENHCFS